MLDHVPVITSITGITDPVIAWGAGYVAGWDTADELAVTDGRPEPTYRVSIREMERAGRRRLWDQMVISGEYPDPEEIERRLWPSIIERLRRPE